MVWLNEGDKNTRFFHLSTLKYRAKNQISNLKRGNIKIFEEKEISEEMVSFFSTLMTPDSNIDPNHQDEILNVIPSLVTVDQKKLMGAIPNNEEILKVVCSLAGDKSGGPDGFPMFFFKK